MAFALRENRLAYVNLAGHRSARAEAIAFFNHSEQCVARVMLMCLKHDNSGMPKCALRNTSNIRTHCDSFTTLRLLNFLNKSFFILKQV